MKTLILAFMLAASGAFAQTPAPEWLSQIKLSGLSGSTDERLALINGKTFSQGEANNLKLAGGKIVFVKCLEFREQSVVVQIEDLPNPYELTIAGGIVVVDKNSVAALRPPPVARIESPAPVVKPSIFAEAAHHFQSIINGKTFPLTIILFVAGLFVALVVGGALGFGATRLQRPKNSGGIGEAILADAIGRSFSRAHLLLNNVTLPTTGGTTQIDHVLVADTGIFVIETKHYAGWIFGNPQEEEWTQTIYKKKSSFQNPIRQNYGHVKALQALFDLPEDYFHSVVVFTGDAEFKTDLGPNVVRLAGLIPFLNTERPVILDEGQRASVIGYIEMKRERRSVETDEYHINNVRSRSPSQTSPP